MSTLINPPFSTSKKHTCSKCQTPQEYPEKMQPTIFVCPKCKNAYTRLIDNWSYLSGRKTLDYKYLQLGMRAFFDNEYFMVVGMVEYQMSNQQSFWREYLLFSESGNRLFLSESEGHWVKLTESNALIQDNQSHVVLTTTEGTKYFEKIYYYDTSVKSIEGLFDFPVFTQAHCREFIAPPEHIVIEKRNNEKSIFYGHYLTENDLEKAFDQALTLPPRYGVGASEPFYFGIDVNRFIQTLVAACFLIFFVNIFNNSLNKRAIVYSHNQILEDSVCKKMVVTPSFNIEGTTSPLAIHLSANLSNNWVEYGITLINEKTQEEKDVDIGVEFYTGVDQGESWAEGQSRNSFTLCGVAAGRYHLELVPQKGGEIPTVDLTFIRGESYFSNVFVTIGGLVVSIIIMLALSSSFEQRRWQHSPYSKM